MAQVLVRQLDDRVVAALKARAQRNHRSLEEELRAILTSAAKPDKQEALRIADEIRSRSKSTGPDSAELIREDRDG
jgi:antitoxin FitA